MFRRSFCYKTVEQLCVHLVQLGVSSPRSLQLWRYRLLSTVAGMFYYHHTGKKLASEQQTLDFVVDVGGALGRYLLNYVHRGPVVPAHTLKVSTDHALRSPQREGNIAAVWAVVVAADAVPLWHSQSVEWHGGGLLAFWDTVTATVPPEQSQQSYDDQEEDHRSRDNPDEQSWLRATAATGVCRPCFWAHVCKIIKE